MKKENNGITLIALVVTIIVLLILAGVSITMVAGDNGIITKASKSKEETRAGDVQETVDLWKTEYYASLNVEWENVLTEDEMLQKLLDDDKVEEKEIDRVNKTIKIGSRTIKYGIENPYEIKTYGETTNYIIALYNNKTGEYEDFNERVIIEDLSDNSIVYDDNIGEYAHSVATASNWDFPDGTCLLFLYDVLLGSGGNYKITVYKNGMSAVWQGIVSIPK